MKQKEEASKTNNPLLCDIESGICERPLLPATPEEGSIKAAGKPVKVIYYTDPICSSCWGIEPQLRKLKLEYGNSLDIEYRMGGLLPDWSYNSGGISKPSDVAHHWDEVSLRYDMPIDGDVWLEDPLSSSYPPSIAFKAAQMQDAGKAVLFLRVLRELLFLQKKNITKWEYVAQAAVQAGLDAAALKKAYEESAKERFPEDLHQAKELGVRGFPTLFFVDDKGNKEKVYGTKPYEVYEQAIVSVHPPVKKHVYARDWKSLFSNYPTLTEREYAELSGMPRDSVGAYLQTILGNGQLEKVETKNGALWISKSLG